MNSFILFFKNTKGLLFSIIAVLIIEISVEFAPIMDYMDPTGVYYTTLKRNVAESENNFDYIMLGDSRSLSIKGKKGDGDNPSFYNFSLPAAGTRYLVHFVQKYLNHNKTPEGIFFAIDPEQFKPSQVKSFHVEPKIWSIFKHRLLNLFSITENLKQYEGEEAYFIFKESLPLLMPTVRHREGLDKLITGMRPRDFIEGNYPYVQSNKRLENLTEETYGQVNLGTYLEIPPGITTEMIQKSVESSINNLNNENIDLTTLDEFIEYAKTKEFEVYILEVPHATGMAETQFYKRIRQEFTERAKLHSHVYLFQFPENSYPLDHYAEGIHFNEKGEKRVNQEFNQFIWPQILNLQNP